MILTGKHSHLNSVPTNGERFDGSQTTFPKLLQAADYQTAMIGKWFLGNQNVGGAYNPAGPLLAQRPRRRRRT